MTDSPRPAIICVDDDEEILTSYRSVLSPADTGSELLDLLQELGDEPAGGPSTAPPEYDLLFARSGEKAIRLLEERLASGRPVIAGFFDMRMPGGIDGIETIRRMRALDPNLYCAVVTAYSDRSVGEIRTLFTGDHQDELLYFNKPFLPDELEQAAINMVSAWNRKRQMEEQLRTIVKHRAGLAQILDAVTELSSMPPSSLKKLLKGILIYLEAIAGGDDGLAVLLPTARHAALSESTGRFGEISDQLAHLSTLPFYREAMARNEIYIEGKICFVPLVFNTELLGAILVEARQDLSCGPLREILAVFRHQMTHLATNRILYEKIVEQDRQVVTDPLTNLYNRRFMLMRLEQELARAARYSLIVGVLMIDLDDFKLINDTYGHAAGDIVLQKVADVLRTTVRGYDMVGRNVDDSGGEDVGTFAIRYGGEEFSLILLQTEAQGAAIVAERVRSRIEAASFEFLGETVTITASIGVCVELMTPDRLQEKSLLDTMIRNADKMLYRAKMNGKNRVELFGGG